jgi:hypothetical protein
LKIRRVKQFRSLRDVPLDEVDMFLLSLVEDEIELSDLMEIAPRNSLECLRRVLRLGQLGLLRLRFDSQDERLLTQGCDEAAAQELLDNANTLRPPPPRWQKLEERRTTRPPAPSHSFISDVDEPKTGIRRRPTPPASQPVKVGKAAG